MVNKDTASRATSILPPGQTYYGAPEVFHLLLRRRAKGSACRDRLFGAGKRGCAVAWIFAGRDIKRMILGPEKSYIGVENKTNAAVHS
jgi:hypothetical protein